MKRLVVQFSKKLHNSFPLGLTERSVEVVLLQIALTKIQAKSTVDLLFQTKRPDTA